MAASSKRRQDEKHLKLVRELGSLPHNKQCFDCHQRGPTYVNMTIGSFVCTSCSGILRGLNPPHRVKSISMASFTPDEIEFVKSRGNEYCRREWMGTYDNNPPIETETKDEQRTKDFMAMKYERKRWYVDVTAFRNLPFPSSCSSQQVTSSVTPSAVSESKPLSTLLGNNVKHVVVQNNQNAITRPVMPSASFPPATSSSTKSAMDLLSDLGGDPFASSASNSSITYSANASFANFDNFVPAFSPRSVGNHSRNTTSPPVPTPTPQQPPPKDKYAALADLDNLFHSNNVVTTTDQQNPNPPNPGNNATVDWDHVTGTTNSPWGGVNGTTPSIFNNSLPNAPTNFPAAPASSNPFTGTSALAPTWNHQNTTTSTSTPSPGNPFVSGFTLSGNHMNVARATSPSEAFPGTYPGGTNMMMGSYSTGGPGWTTVSQIPTSFTSPTNGNYPSYKMAVAAQFGTWQPAVGNPFMAGIGSAPPRPASSNPFL